MQLKYVLSVLFCAILLLTVGSTTAAPRPQDGPAYELTTVGGEPVIYTAPAYSENGFTIGETTAVSEYPLGVRFTTTIDSENGANIQAATLFVGYRLVGNARVNGGFEAATGNWVGIWYPTPGIAYPWQELSFWWSVTDADGNNVQTPPTPFRYEDPTREWYRMETDGIIIYFLEHPDFAAETIADRLADGWLRFEDVLGAAYPPDLTLDYKPILTVFSTNESAADLYIDEYPPATGFGIEQGHAMVNLDWVDLNGLFDGCVYFDEALNTPEARLNAAIGGRMPLVILQQLLFPPLGLPGWWQQGSGQWVAYQAFSAEMESGLNISPTLATQRIRRLASQNPDLLLSFAVSDVPDLIEQADGCGRLTADAGLSFVTWLMELYGGLEFHQAIVDANRNQGMSIYEAIESFAGVPFIELENAWRQIVGFNLLSLAEVDPAAALSPAPDAPYQPGTTLVIAGVRPVQMGVEPGSAITNPCYAGTTVTVLQVGELDGVVWYEIECGAVGWVTLDDLE